MLKNRLIKHRPGESENMGMVVLCRVKVHDSTRSKMDHLIRPHKAVLTLITHSVLCLNVSLF